MKFISWLKDSWKAIAWKKGAWKEEEEEPQILASLGGFSPPAYKKPKEEHEELPEIVPEPIPETYVSRIREEFLSESMAQDLINRAKRRKSRAEEEALLLIL